MNNFSIAIIKTLLISVSTLTIMSSVFLIALIFDISIQNGMPAFENIKFTIMLFIAILLMLVICFCLKLFLSMSIDSRDIQLKKESMKTKSKSDGVTI
ncbi:hypothetical protein [Dickeya fangzhongdai]|uniref:hypothetical protein n=1 Tax=Dickeya fangzhongdai TaxID=1778540 RepID=UPI0023E3E0C6|nr:hypothetical protein [Dickeya fangzhongdai]WES88767.1 hypothetical protein PQ617_21605 [Dickeya fangzhongdai]